MTAKEEIIVSLTTWSARISNIPTVLDTIYAQSLLPDKVVLNLSHREIVPVEVEQYIDNHGVEVFWTEDTKVYKKIIHTLKRYPNACVINIDDDMLYPPGMIEDFMNTHNKFPNNPICGNHAFSCGLICHCGEASLTKLEFFGGYLDCIDDNLRSHCHSSDMVYTYFATKAGHPYVPTRDFYGVEYCRSYKANNSWSKDNIRVVGIQATYAYLTNRFGPLPEFFHAYVSNPYEAELATIASETLLFARKQEYVNIIDSQVRNSYSYRIGSWIVSPFRLMRLICKKMYGKS